MRSIIDEISAGGGGGGVKTEHLEDGQSQTTTLQGLENAGFYRELEVKDEMVGAQEKSLQAALTKKRNVVGVVPPNVNLKEVELVRDETGMFKCVCCWKVIFCLLCFKFFHTI